MILVDEESKANEGEANIVCKHVSGLIASHVKPEEIAIITPYNLQMELIKAKLHPVHPLVEVKSVDGFQGREKEAIVLSLVRSNSRGEIGFLADQRRINVAITRARRHLCVVGDSQTCKNNKFLKSFLDYCNQFADVRSGFDYINERVVTLTGGQQNDFEDVTFSKLKVSEKSKRNEKVRNKIASYAKNDLTSTEEKERQFREEVTKIINKLNLTNNSEHCFSAELNSFQRRIVHELSEQFKLYHESRDDEVKKNRFIVISTKRFTSFEQETATASAQYTVEPESVKLEVEKTKQSSIQHISEIESNKFDSFKNETTTSRNKQKKKKDLQPQPSQSDKKETVGNLLGELEDQESNDLKFRNDCRKCKNCEKFILISNFTMHELHCSKLQPKKISNEETAKGSAKSTTTATSSLTYTVTNKKEKVKKNPIETAKTDDFDELLNMFQKSNSVCNYMGCKVLVKTLGQNCEFCSNRFCFQHSLAEVIFVSKFYVYYY